MVFAKGQSGRSMVEMLGVLAIMGILVLIGVKAYTFAMNRHRANELVNEAQKRAVMVAMQITAGRKGADLSIDEFNNTTPNGTFELMPYRDGSDTFAMTVSGVDADVCQQMKNMGGPGSIFAVIGDCQSASEVNLQFNNDLKRGVPDTMLLADGWTGDETGSSCDLGTKPTVPSGKKACSVCVKSGNLAGEWYDSDALCEAGQVCVDGACSDTLAGTGCAKNSDCKNKQAYDGSNCGASGCFCGYYTAEAGSASYLNSKTGPTAANGTCFSVSSYKNSDSQGNFVWSTKKMDWFTARNFCKANGKKMITISALQCAYTAEDYETAIAAGQNGQRFCCERKDPDMWTRCNNSNPAPAAVLAIRAAGAPYNYYWLNSFSKGIVSWWGTGVGFSLGTHGSDISYDWRNGSEVLLNTVCQ